MKPAGEALLKCRSKARRHELMKDGILMGYHSRRMPARRCARVERQLAGAPRTARRRWHGRGQRDAAAAMLPSRPCRRYATCGRTDKAQHRHRRRPACY